MDAKQPGLFDLRIPPSPLVGRLLGAGAVALILTAWFLATRGATPEQVGGGLGQPNRCGRRNRTVAREQPLHAFGVRSLCAGGNTRHTYTLVRGRNRCDSSNSGSHPAHRRQLGVIPDGTGQRVQHRHDQRRAGCRPHGGRDYQTVRPKILSSHYSGYQVLDGGQGAGTVATWKLQATKSRVRDVKASVDVAGHTVIEKDANSSMITNWTVAPAGTGSSVTVKTSWQGAGGIGGFFEKTFAPLGLRKIQAEVLDNLKKQVEGR